MITFSEILHLHKPGLHGSITAEFVSWQKFMRVYRGCIPGAVKIKKRVIKESTADNFTDFQTHIYMLFYTYIECYAQYL